MVCHNCRIRATKHGRDRNGRQRWKCKPCRKTWTEPYERLLGEMRVPEEKALLALNLLCEGSSIRSTERLTGLHRDTVMKLLVRVGEGCERFLEERIRDVPVEDVQCDEIWGFVEMKERTKVGKGLDSVLIGDAYCFVGLERDSKLVLAWHLGRRTVQHTDAFVEKLDRATAGRFQLSTDGFAAYPDSISYHLGTRTDYAVLIKKYGSEEKSERRYSPPRIIGIDVNTIHGEPEPGRICTSHVERSNLTMRMSLRRLTRLTNAFSRKWENLRAALALYFAWYNFCRMHSSIRMTPAIKAGIANRPWSMKDLVAATTHS